VFSVLIQQRYYNLYAIELSADTEVLLGLVVQPVLIKNWNFLVWVTAWHIAFVPVLYQHWLYASTSDKSFLLAVTLVRNGPSQYITPLLFTNSPKFNHNCQQTQHIMFCSLFSLL